MATDKAKKKLPSGRHLSQIKRQRQNEKIAERNQVVRSDFRTSIKKVRQAVENKDPKAAQQALIAAKSKIDKAVTKGVLHKNNAARKKSRLSHLVASLGK